MDKNWPVAFIVNSIVVFHGVVAGCFLLAKSSGSGFSGLGLNFPLLMGLIPIALVAGIAWTQTPNSVGRIFVVMKSDLPDGWFQCFSGLVTLVVLLLTLALMISLIGFAEI